MKFRSKLKKGDRCRHVVFGDGTVRGRSPGIIKILFDDYPDNLGRHEFYTGAMPGRLRKLPSKRGRK